MNRHLLIAALSVMLALPASAQTVGDPAPSFSYPALGGGQISLDDYRGMVVFVFLFGNGCPACLAVGNRTESEVHQVFKNHPAYRSIGLDLYSGSTTASVTAFRNQTGVTYPLALQAIAMKTLYGTTFDRLLVIGADGVLRYKSPTVVSSTLDAAKAVVSDLLSAIPTAIEEQPGAGFSLAPGFPNPFTNRTEFVFQTDNHGYARVSIHDLLGHEVAVIADGDRPAGIHRVTFEAPTSLPAGVYTCTLQTPRGRLSRTLALVR